MPSNQVHLENGKCPNASKLMFVCCCMLCVVTVFTMFLAD